MPTSIYPLTGSYQQQDVYEAPVLYIQQPPLQPRLTSGFSLENVVNLLMRLMQSHVAFLQPVSKIEDCLYIGAGYMKDKEQSGKLRIM